ncbi:MAG: glutamate--tRNA ligase [Candidatus Liptonbacteria bacterium RIFCSPLOWO2_01_FULL_56_20]|uniref:Glutamate--tRNA ligase n=1 Tax=Candidatus Liptonbacteria bacterium RIFCSPLOWO2_01_FULL_56_20 TaxID=1798652 RepID=A0A1G2CJK0_9BACT|nr:MAG: glutamate--tRNA ligase [Candidatus Liptonbacteria bacterium RIFCSPLOWO2_01_FULL_56_20]
MVATKAKSASVRVRFPPSPTGHFHVGGARTALFNWLYARQHGGKFILRIEDTDAERSDQKYEIELVEALKWLGLDWDEGVDWQLVNHEWQGSSRGEHGPYRQSERAPVYKRYLEKLLHDGKAYYCHCTKEDLEAERQAQLAEGMPPKYSGHCRNLTESPRGKKPELIRFKTPEARMEFKDLIRGTVSFDASLFGDLVIARSVESPLYNFAVVVDDYEMKITHVIRGEDHLPNTPKQILFARALGFPEPLYGHLPLILASDRSKLSKRFAEVSMLKYRDEGYLPEAMANFLAFLGWHPKDDREVFSLEELKGEFDLKRVQKAGAVFNQEKLDWLNAQHMRRLSIDELLNRLQPFLGEKGIAAPKSFVRKVIAAERERMKTLGDFLKLAGFFFELPDYDAALLVWKGNSMARIKEVLEKILARLEKSRASDFSREKLPGAVAELIKEYDRGAVLWPLRVALSGQSASPDPLAIAGVLGKEETLRRVTAAINKIGLAL